MRQEDLEVVYRRPDRLYSHEVAGAPAGGHWTLAETNLPDASVFQHHVPTVIQDLFDVQTERERDAITGFLAAIGGSGGGTLGLGGGLGGQSQSKYRGEERKLAERLHRGSSIVGTSMRQQYSNDTADFRTPRTLPALPSEALLSYLFVLAKFYWEAS
jgi:hypothetical protein